MGRQSVAGFGLLVALFVAGSLDATSAAGTRVFLPLAPRGSASPPATATPTTTPATWATVLVPGPTPTPSAPTELDWSLTPRRGPQPWVTILCRLADAPDVTPRPREW